MQPWRGLLGDDSMAARALKDAGLSLGAARDVVWPPVPPNPARPPQ